MFVEKGGYSFPSDPFPSLQIKFAFFTGGAEGVNFQRGAVQTSPRHTQPVEFFKFFFICLPPKFLLCLSDLNMMEGMLNKDNG